MPTVLPVDDYDPNDPTKKKLPPPVRTSIPGAPVERMPGNATGGARATMGIVPSIPTAPAIQGAQTPYRPGADNSVTVTNAVPPDSNPVIASGPAGTPRDPTATYTPTGSTTTTAWDEARRARSVNDTFTDPKTGKKYNSQGQLWDDSDPYHPTWGPVPEGSGVKVVRDQQNGTISLDYGNGHVVSGNADHPAAGAANPAAGGGANPPTAEAIKIDTPGMDQRQAALAAQLAAVQGRTAPQAAGATLGPVATAGGANVGAATQATAATLSPVERAQIVSLGPAAQAGAVRFGPAGQATADKLGPAAQAQAAALAPAQTAEESAFRADQQALVDKLRRQVSGEESVSQLQLNRARDQALADNLSLSRSARPGAAVAAQRTAAQRQSSIEGDFAARAAEAGINERNTAAGALSTLLGTARGQDLSNTQFNTTQGNSFSQLLAQLQQQANLQNASQTNQQAQVGAQLGTSASIANAGNQTQMGIAQGQTSAQVGIANAQQANAQAALAAQLAQSGSQFNAQQGNAANSERARLQQEVELANAAAANQRNLTAAGLDLNARQFDAGATNTQAALAAQLAQNNSQFSTSAGLQMTGLNDAATQAALAGQLGNAALAQQGQVAGAQLSLQNQAQVNQVALANMDDATRRYISQQAIAAGKANDPGFIASLINGVLTVGGAIVGGIYGGPAGAVAGGAAGHAVGGAVT